MLIAAILMLTMAFTLTGCGSDSKADETPATQAPAAAGFTVEDTTFYYRGIGLALDGKVEDVLTPLGDADEVKSELSCHGEGEDKTYIYGDFTMKTYPKNGEDHILEVLVTKAGVPTSKGIQVGSTLAEVTAAYGSEYNKIAKFCVFDAGEGKTLRFAVEDDKVVQIDYYFNV